MDEEEKTLEDFVKRLVNEFPSGDSVALKIYTFYKAYLKELKK